MFLYRFYIAVAFIIFPCCFKRFLSVLFEKDRGSLEGKSGEHHQQCLVQSFQCDAANLHTPNPIWLWPLCTNTHGERRRRVCGTGHSRTSAPTQCCLLEKSNLSLSLCCSACTVLGGRATSKIQRQRFSRFSLDHPLHMKSHSRTDIVYSGCQYHEVRITFSPVS